MSRRGTRRVTAWVASTIVVLSALTLMPGMSAAAAQPNPRPVAVIGDFGSGNADEKRVADLVRSIDPVAVVTTGDNVYDSDDYQHLVGDYYGRWISQQRFWPALGNHDVAEGLDAFDAEFPYLGGRHVYSTGAGGMRFFVVDSTTALDDPADAQRQRDWLRSALQRSTARWKVVVLHHPPYSSGTAHGSSPELRWPFREWGADLVLSGHEHNYERLVEGGLTYVVDGAGGKDLYALGDAIPGSRVRVDDAFGALVLTATPSTLTGVFRTDRGRELDRWTIRR